jgi:DNA-binding transcriptional LysR family regulator
MELRDLLVTVMDLRKLRQFLVIAESPSLSRAAERLHIAQPALTQAMKLLEQELGVALIERHARGVSLTELGKLLADQARLILREVERTRELIRERAANPAGKARLALPSLVAGYLTVPLLQRVKTRQPGIELTLLERDSASAEIAVKTGHCDAALTFMASVGSEMVLRPVLVDDLAAVVPAALSSEVRISGIIDLIPLKLALLPKDDPLRAALDEVAWRHSAALDIAIEVAATADLRALVAAGYTTVVPSMAAIRLAADNHARVCLLNEPRIPCGLFLLIPRHRTLSLAAELAIEELVRAVEDLVNANIWAGRYVGSSDSSAASISIVAN